MTPSIFDKETKIPPGQLEITEPTTYATVSLTEEEVSGVSPTIKEIAQVFTTSATTDEEKTVPTSFIIYSTTEEEISGVSPTIEETTIFRTSAPDKKEVTSGSTPPSFQIRTKEVTNLPQEKRTEKTPSNEEETKPTSTVTDSTTIEDVSGVSPTSLETTIYMTKAPTDIKETVPPSYIIHSTTEGEIPGVSPTSKVTTPAFIPSPSDEKELTTEVTPTTFQVKTEEVSEGEIPSVSPTTKDTTSAFIPSPSDEKELTTQVTPTTFEIKTVDVSEIGSGTMETSSSVLYSTRPTSKQRPITIVSEEPTHIPDVFPSTSSTTIPETSIEYETSTTPKVASTVSHTTVGEVTEEVTGKTIFTTEGVTSGASQSTDEATSFYKTRGPTLSTSGVTPSIFYIETKIPPGQLEITEPTTYATVSPTEEEVSGVSPTSEEIAQMFTTSATTDREETVPTSFTIYSTIEEEISGVSPSIEETTIFRTSAPDIMEVTSGATPPTFQIITTKSHKFAARKKNRKNSLL